MFCRSEDKVRVHRRSPRIHEIAPSERLNSEVLEDLVAEKGSNSLSHYNLVHKPVPIHQPMKIPNAKAAVDIVGKVRESASMETVESQKQESSRKGTKRVKHSSFCDSDGLVPPQELGVGATVTQR